MRFARTANPEQLAIMTKAFDDYCLEQNITMTLKGTTPPTSCCGCSKMAQRPSRN